MWVLLLDLRLDVSYLWWHSRLQWIDMRLGLNVPNVDLNWIQVDIKHLTHADPSLIVATITRQREYLHEARCPKLQLTNNRWLCVSHDIFPWHDQAKLRLHWEQGWENKQTNAQFECDSSLAVDLISSAESRINESIGDRQSHARVCF